METNQQILSTSVYNCLFLGTKYRLASIKTSKTMSYTIDSKSYCTNKTKQLYLMTDIYKHIYTVYLNKTNAQFIFNMTCLIMTSDKIAN